MAHSATKAIGKALPCETCGAMVSNALRRSCADAWCSLEEKPPPRGFRAHHQPHNSVSAQQLADGYGNIATPSEA